MEGVFFSFFLDHQGLSSQTHSSQLCKGRNPGVSVSFHQLGDKRGDLVVVEWSKSRCSLHFSSECNTKRGGGRTNKQTGQRGASFGARRRKPGLTFPKCLLKCHLWLSEVIS